MHGSDKLLPSASAWTAISPSPTIHATAVDDAKQRVHQPKNKPTRCTDYTRYVADRLLKHRRRNSLHSWIAGYLKTRTCDDLRAVKAFSNGKVIVA